MGATVIVPFERFPAELLTRVIEGFVSREGTDYGAVELTLEEKVEQVRGQLRRREAFVVFEGESESVTIVGAREAAALRARLAEEGYEGEEGGEGGEGDEEG
ncbi:MAG: YheU family protein [Deltaproteobacteria bacterium]|nr:YheU family protein [Deltaproteobacteria bacterium]